MPYSSKKTGKNEITVFKKDSGKVVGHTTPEKYNDYMAALHMHEPGMAEGGEVLSPDENKKLSDYLLRQTHGDVAEYHKDPHPAPDVVRSVRSKTIVPKGGELDRLMKPQSEMKDVSLGQTLRLAEGGDVPDIGNEADNEENQDTQNEEKIQDSHPGHTAEDLGLDQAIKGYQAQSDKYGPEQEKAVLDQIMKEREGIGRNIGRGVASFTDTAAPVFGAGTGTLKNLDERENEMNKARLESVPTLQGMNEKQLSQKMALDQMTSGTPLGASETAPLAAFFEKVGIPKQEIPGLLKNPSAAKSVVEPFATLMSNQEKIQMETLLKQLELSQHATQLKTESEKSKADIENARKQRRMEATKTYGGLPWYSKLFGTETAKAAESEMKDSIAEDKQPTQTFSSDVLNYAQKHGITPDQANQIKMKRMGH